MITVKQEEKLIDKIKSLSELELSSVIDEIRQHCWANKMHHLFDDRNIEDLEDELSELEAKVKSLKDDLRRIDDLASQISNLAS